MGSRNVVVAPTVEKEMKEQEVENIPQTGESLLLKKVLLKSEKEVVEPAKRKALFKTMCKVKGKCCKVIIDSRSTDNLESTELVKKLNLNKVKHPTPYKVSWLQKGHQLLVNEQCEVDLQVGSHKDRILCDVMPMDVCQILLGRPWQYDRNAIHEGKKNVYKIQKYGLNQTLVPLQERETDGNNDPKALLMSGKEFLQQMEDNEVNFSLVCKPRVVFITAKISDMLVEIQYILNVFHDIIVNDLPS